MKRGSKYLDIRCTISTNERTIDVIYKICSILSLDINIITLMKITDIIYMRNIDLLYIISRRKNYIQLK